MTGTANVQSVGQGGSAGSRLSDTQAASAAGWNNTRWHGDFRRELLSFLRNTAVDAAQEFGPADAQEVAGRQARAGADVDGMLGPCTMAVLLHSGLRFHSHPPAEPGAVTLLFYPGELEDLADWRGRIKEAVDGGGGYRDVDPPAGVGRLYILLDGGLVARYAARGGPPQTVQDGPKHTADPTAHGTFTLGPGHPIVTSNWPYSQLPWGAEIRKQGEHFQCRVTESAEWSWVSGPHCTLTHPLSPEDFTDLAEVTRNGNKCLLWNKNDFGKVGWNLTGTPDYIHTTPETEEAAQNQQPVVLAPSHGCIHVVPGERDDMMARGYLQRGVRIVVKAYDEHLLPAQLRATLQV